MIGQCRITANLIEVDEDTSALHMGVKIEGKGNPAVIQCFNSEIFEAILKAMKDTNIKAFHEAIINFTNEELGR